ncbi:bifunctional hydroxymethylpyrimidine kinase/phosphomethylpyrimidine kinase [Sutcliffiella cohnii]|uniref:Hydroxymethylpyrimidine/phosphomethylpyrimidine kinase n=1 Tax=Sutcliffiella cohnii TaxID=33932 RepID=A0A223KM67_9BACI|nr:MULTISPECIES: bifunctional hydroxymethylpyrimidine kinase/phosphomethylpyrimidine kinase [Sutcliffiella]AST90444.1 bifunctional hydroxymethylpyrimidine kinase/phosphomethylpyrimidine kinase [Sutcliffiella cohnii]MED4017440.1 bifunctional hydroxymethylpyrimidine kinase/phosphomethylpyrimidine kinase [Sutcliffiella cohnii]WBL16098.1 bifunctional hydroxymethylpyrimidine kinase/phosphomethylpyrimidine kinase [Sutcliffiella sp. NC1]
MVKKALTIAGSDSGGGAGIQADLKTFQELNVYGMSAITAITAQNTLGVQGVYALPLEAVIEQMNSIEADLRPDALKTGMLFNSELIEAVANNIREFNWGNVVIDPVMIAKGGAKLLQQEAINSLRETLIPLATVITPNIPEAEVITELSLHTIEARKKAAKVLHKLGADYVVVKGGHGEEEELVDLLFDGQSFVELKSTRISTRHTHGTGCTFAAAITAELAKGKTVEQAVKVAKDFIHAAIKDELGIGSGHGPTNHWAYRNAAVHS